MATHRPTTILLVRTECEVHPEEYAVFRGFISDAEAALLEIYNTGALWAPSNLYINATNALIEHFVGRDEVDAWLPGNPVDETPFSGMVPDEKRKMLKALQRQWLTDTYEHVFVTNRYEGVAEMSKYVAYLQKSVRMCPGLLGEQLSRIVEQLPELLWGGKREKIIPSSQ
jgi:hypothetical protein